MALFVLPAFAQDGPQITFNKELHEFGDLQEGEPAEFVFNFTNTGNKPLILTSVDPSCGCTAADFTQEPVMPGQSGKIAIEYDTHKLGNFYKSIMVNSNVSGEGSSKLIYIKGNVIPAGEDSKSGS